MLLVYWLHMVCIIDLTRISHEHCVNLARAKKKQNDQRGRTQCHIYTLFTKGQSIQRPLLQYFGNGHSLLWSIAKTSKLTPPGLMRKAG